MTTDDEVAEFNFLNAQALEQVRASSELKELSQHWINASAKYRYTYQFEALGRPIIQFPQDIVAVSELIWSVRPDLVIETGIAHGGSLIHSASQLALLDLCDAAAAGRLLDPSHPKRLVLGIDIDIRAHNRRAVESHPLSGWIKMIEGSSVDDSIVGEVRSTASRYPRVMLLLDSNHTRDHVLAELHAYADLVSVNSYCVVFDTVIDNMPKGSFPDRPWDIGNSPMTAVEEFLAGRSDFVVDDDIISRLLISVAPGGYLRRVGN